MRAAVALALVLTLSGCASLLATPSAGQVELITRTYDPASLESPKLAALIASSDAPFARLEHVAADGTRLPYRLMSPAATSERLPLVIVLHGSGAIGTDNTAQIGAFAKGWALPDVVARFPAYVAVPQVAVRSADYGPDDDGLPASHPGASLPAVLDLVETLVRTLPVDPSRVYVVGFSMGGSAALNALLIEPERFAAAVAFSPVPPSRALAGKVSGLPVLLVHGDADDENPYPSDRAWAEALAKAGGHPRFIVYAGMEHRTPPDMLAWDDSWRTWLFAQTR